MASADDIAHHNDNAPVVHVHRITTKKFLECMRASTEKDLERARDVLGVSEEVRAQAESMLRDGVKPSSVARWLGIPPQAVYRIKRASFVAAISAALLMSGCAVPVGTWETTVVK